MDKKLVEPRQIADAALSGSWVPHDRATLGVLFYRGVELLRDDATSSTDCKSQARTLLRLACKGYETTKMLDVVPVALGVLAEAELESGDAARAIELTSRAAHLLEEGKPSLLNEALVFVVLHDALKSQGDLLGAKAAIARGLPKLKTRIASLQSTEYITHFLREIPANRRLIELSRQYGYTAGELQLATP